MNQIFYIYKFENFKEILGKFSVKKIEKNFQKKSVTRFFFNNKIYIDKIINKKKF